MFLKSIKINNLLSFGPDSPALPMQPLNVLIGANGVGKSNLLDVIGLLQAAPTDLNRPMRETGGIEAWLWKRDGESSAAIIDVIADIFFTNADRYLGHVFSIDQDIFDDLHIGVEKIESIAKNGRDLIFNLDSNDCTISYYDENRSIKNRKISLKDINRSQSILCQKKDMETLPELTMLGYFYNGIKLYREWSMGRHTMVRIPQSAHARHDVLDENFSNLGMVLGRFKKEPMIKMAFLQALQELNGDIEDFEVITEAGKVQIFFHEGTLAVPASHLSDGTLRYLSLLAVLLHPNPPPLVCIEEPELGLHPDLMPTMARLLKQASQRMQLIVTTHSDILVDAFSDTPESIVVCDKIAGQTHMRRLEAAELADWLDQYRLGAGWLKGRIGGVRW